MSKKNKGKPKQGENMGWKEKLAKMAKEKLGHEVEASQTSPVKEAAGTLKMEHADNVQNPATTPYNFVPLNEKVVQAEGVPPDFDRYYIDENNKRYTGYIDLTIETKTPLYIRDTLNEAEMRQAEEAKKRKENFINPDFFSPAGKIRIPGSSLRGMVRNLVEIMSHGKFEFFEKERKYHFRSFADKSLDLKDQYAKKIMEGDYYTGFCQKVKAGYLFKKGIHYRIRPAQILSGNDKQFFRIEEDDAIKWKIISEKMKNEIYQCQTHKNERSNIPDNCPICKKNLIKRYVTNRNYKWFDYKPIKFIYDKSVVHSYSKKLRFAKVKNAWQENDNKAPSTAVNGVIVLSAWMQGQNEGKHLHWVIGPKDNNKILNMMDGVIEDYKNDVSRHDNADILKEFAENEKAEVPCFYITEEINENGGKVTKVSSFGHTGIFCLAYEKKINDFLHIENKSFKKIDIAETIFGNEKTFAGRVFFEDAFGDHSQTNKGIKIPEILSTPKPTTFQHYLEQEILKIKVVDKKGNIRGLRTYNDNTILRGYKLYWHKTGDNWQAEGILFAKDKFKKLLEDNKDKVNEAEFNNYKSDEEGKIRVNLPNLPAKLKDIILKSVGIYETQHTKIKPVEANKTFTGIIRFENLSRVELGALLFALALPSDCCHKLGMGKPLGLGSVKITPTLHLSNRKSRYTDLLAEWENQIQESTNKGEAIDDFKKEFQSYVLNELGEKTVADLWEVNRMKELKRMLDFEKKPSDDKTKYMNLAVFRQRKVLPKPTEIK